MRIGKFNCLLSMSHVIECRCGHDSVPAQPLTEEAFRAGLEVDGTAVTLDALRLGQSHKAG